jgi:Uma2 family endonuclease
MGDILNRQAGKKRVDAEMHMTAQPHHKFTPQEYLAFERQSHERHEYLDGEIFAMVGGSERHAWITMNIGARLYPQMVEQGCRIYAENLGVRAKLAQGYFYPDLVIVCGEREFDDPQRDILLNPTVLIEVLSPSTEKYDRGDKFHAYRTIESLQAYVLVSQKVARIEQFIRREGEAWDWRVTEGLEATFELVLVGASLPLAQVYQGVSFDGGEEDHS